MRRDFTIADSESDVEQFLLTPLLTDATLLAIPDVAIRTKHTLRIVDIDKGTHKRRYHPDYVVYSDALPVLVAEAKSPAEDVPEGFREAQLYAHELNKDYPSGLNPAAFILATNGIDLVYGPWDAQAPTRLPVKNLLAGDPTFSRFKDELHWNTLQAFIIEIAKKLYPQAYFFPYERLGPNRVRLSKIGMNSFAEDLSPLIKKYFQSENPEFEVEIIERAYVSTDETTKYERIFETYLRDRVTPVGDSKAKVLETTRRSEAQLTSLIQGIGSKAAQTGFTQLIIGGVGAGKTTFLKRYFSFLIPQEISKSTVLTYFNFNEAPDDLSELNTWLCDGFIERVRSQYTNLIQLEDPDGLKAVFSHEIKGKGSIYECDPVMKRGVAG